uniref:Uncharacterized protein n=1 Tax=Anguilla anguilla TaxID=7936 RepID=A0A0E9T705_ANGAN
MPMKTSSM